ncbi:amidohydrolase [Amycolatopsis acidicola]|uniref:Amidohydrolase n=1 Tax=Amycolatopsis acidicola TaxID=2596893 RepID=A0A5N0V5B3_9PSEU|nr:amidohydrolase family protein [Amycolatopsis acidicola]KAA9161599.1 amidohydrolase [Amycolatopsis acidicola]
MSDRIDTHQHYLPGFYRDLLDRHGKNAGGWPMPDWSTQSALNLMDELRIATGVLSLSSPGVRFGDQSRDIARRVNEFGAELVKDRPDRFGLFASLPLPDVDGALAEVAYAFDELNADGVVLMSNVEGTYLGERSYEPLWEELNRRGAVVFVHPDAPPMQMLDGLPAPLLDFPFDTTRTAVHMVANGVLSRHTAMKVLLSHAGGFLPYAAYRFTGAAMFNEGITAESVFTDLRRFYFDTALSSTPATMPSLLAFADHTHITFGSDFPFAPASAQITAMLDDAGLDDGLHTAINRGNAEHLFPRLAR